MRKSNIDNLWSLGFMRICMANFLLFASLYMLFPVLPAVMVSRLGVSTAQMGSMFLVFAVGMFLVGPFHAYLGDAYKRKHVLVYSTFIMLAATVSYLFADTFTKLLLLAVVQGGTFYNNAVLRQAYQKRGRCTDGGGARGKAHSGRKAREYREARGEVRD